jgi:hypothetical protein
MDANRIEDNTSYQNFKKQIEGFELVAKAAKFFAFFGIKNPSIDDAIAKLTEIKSNWDFLSKAPDRFNSYFSKLGWIAHESMNIDLMKVVIQEAEAGKIDLAEDRLMAYYSSNEMRFLISRLQATKAFKIRLPLLNLVYRDTLEGRYHSVVPVLLMMIDGAVNDISKSKGFFAENTDLTAWDSIAAHSTGLAQLQKIFNVGRPVTVEEDIDNPYRNGILHGRDLGYANQKVVAKSWAALFAVNDWARSLAEGKKVKPVNEPKPSLIQELKKIKQYSDRLSENEKVLQRINNWQKRQLVVGVDLPQKGLSSQYGDFTPEQEVVKFAEYWTKKNYGNIGKQVHSYYNQISPDKQNAGKARNALSKKVLKDYKIVGINDIAPVISEVTMEFFIEEDNKAFSIDVVFRLIYESADDKIVTFGDIGGRWKFFDSALEFIANPY